MSKYPKHDKVVKLAAAEIGVVEQPNGSNSGPRVREYQAATWLGGTGWPWCAAYCCWLWQKAGFTLSYRGAGAYKWYDEGAQHVGRKIRRDQWAQVIPGDGVVFRVGSGHIGIVEKVTADAVQSIDGNVSNEVDRRTRPLSSVYGFVGLAEKPSPTAKPPKAPAWEVVTSASGHKVIYFSGLKAIQKRLPRFLKRFPTGLTIRRRKR